MPSPPPAAEPGRAAAAPRSGVTVDNTGETYDCSYDATLLDAALAAGVAMPHNCRGGVCGTCKAEVIEGAIARDARRSIALSEAEAAAGLCLCCRTQPRSPTVRLRMLARMDARDAPPAAPVAFRSEVVAAYLVTPSVMRLTMTAPRDGTFRYRGGMHVEFALPGIEPARPYSIAVAPDGDAMAPEGLLTFYVVRYDGGRGSVWLHDNAKPGVVLTLQGPYGTFAFPDDHDGPVLALGGGTGLAPLLAAVGAALAGGFPHPVQLVHSVRERREMFAGEELARLASRHPNFSYRTTLTRDPDAPVVWAKGRITALLSAERPDLSGAQVIIAGRPEFVAACATAAQACHAASNRIIVDEFVSRA